MQSGGDADTLVATTAVDIANSKPTVVTGVTDFLILLIHFVNKKRYIQNNIFLHAKQKY